MLKIHVEEIIYLDEQLRRINRVPLNEIEFYENGVKLEIDPKLIEEFEFTGLGNVNFVLMKYYSDKIEEDKL